MGILARLFGLGRQQETTQELNPTQGLIGNNNTGGSCPSCKGAGCSNCGGG